MQQIEKIDSASEKMFEDLKDSLGDLSDEIEQFEREINEIFGDVLRELEDDSVIGVSDLRDAECLAYEISYAKENSEHYDST